MNKCLARAALATLLTLGAERANAQITTVVAAPPKRNQPSQQVAAQREQAAQDSIARVTLTGMKEWVDSAATALAIRPDTGKAPADTLAAVPPTVPAPSPAPPRAAPTTEFRSGARAPNTATPFPALALAGAMLIVLGVAVARSPRGARSRVRR